MNTQMEKKIMARTLPILWLVAALLPSLAHASPTLEECLTLGTGPFEDEADLDTWIACEDLFCELGNEAAWDQCTECMGVFSYGSASFMGGGHTGAFKSCKATGPGGTCTLTFSDGTTETKTNPVDLGLADKRAYTECEMTACDIWLQGVGNEPSGANPGDGNGVVTRANDGEPPLNQLARACQDAASCPAAHNCEQMRQDFETHCTSAAACGGPVVVAHSWGTTIPAVCDLPIHYAGGMCADSAASCYANPQGSTMVYVPGVGFMMVPPADPTPAALDNCCNDGFLAGVAAVPTCDSPSYSCPSGTHSLTEPCLIPHPFESCYEESIFGSPSSRGIPYHGCSSGEADFHDPDASCTGLDLSNPCIVQVGNTLQFAGNGTDCVCENVNLGYCETGSCLHCKGLLDDCTRNYQCCGELVCRNVGFGDECLFPDEETFQMEDMMEP
jgi:hypothetical protein